jgi:hypothetical protein
MQGSPKLIELGKVLHIPSFGNNLILSHSLRNNHVCLLCNSEYSVIDKTTGEVTLKVKVGANSLLEVMLKLFALSDQMDHIYMTCVATPDIELLHCHFSHVCKEWLWVITHKLNINIKGQHLGQCQTCIKKKQCWPVLVSGLTLRLMSRLEVMHSNVCGPLQVPTQEGAQYFITFINGHSQKAQVYLLALKGNVFRAFHNFMKATPTSTHV